MLARTRSNWNPSSLLAGAKPLWGNKVEGTPWASGSHAYLHSPKDRKQNIRGSMICNNPKLVAIPKYLSARQGDKCIVAHSPNGILYAKGSQWSTALGDNIGESQKHTLKLEKQQAEKINNSDSTYLRPKVKTTLPRWDPEWWLLWAWV